jgi:hypothetical protein
MQPTTRPISPNKKVLVAIRFVFLMRRSFALDSTTDQLMMTTRDRFVGAVPRLSNQQFLLLTGLLMARQAAGTAQSRGIADVISRVREVRATPKPQPLDMHRQLLGRMPYLATADAAFFAQRNELGAQARDVKRVAIPNRNTKSVVRPRPICHALALAAFPRKLSKIIFAPESN